MFLCRGLIQAVREVALKRVHPANLQKLQMTSGAWIRNVDFQGLMMAKRVDKHLFQTKVPNK